MHPKTILFLINPIQKGIEPAITMICMLYCTCYRHFFVKYVQCLKLDYVSGNKSTTPHAISLFSYLDFILCYINDISREINFKYTARNENQHKGVLLANHCIWSIFLGISEQYFVDGIRVFPFELHFCFYRFSSRM